MNRKQFVLLCLAPLQPFFSIHEGFKRAKLFSHLKTAFKNDFQYTKKLWKELA